MTCSTSDTATPVGGSRRPVSYTHLDVYKRQLCCFDEFYVLARDHQYHDEISVYYNTINYVDSFEGIDIESNKISIFFPAYDAEPAFRETYSPEFSDKLLSLIHI